MIVESTEDVIHLSGALRSNFWETIHTAISLVLKSHPNGVIIDCSGLTECTASGAETFRSAMEFIGGHRARVIVTSVPDNVMEVLRTVADVRSQLPIAKTIDEARKSLNLLEADEDESPKKKKKISGGTRGSVIVCLSGTDADVFLMKTSILYCEAIAAQAVAIFPILIPRELPLMAPLPTEEGEAERVLDDAEARFSDVGVPCSIKIARGRDLGQAIELAAEDYPNAPVFLGVSPSFEAAETGAKLIKSVLARVKNPVSIIRGAV